MKKTIYLLISLIVLSGCAQSTAMLAPVIAVGTSGGNVYQSGLSYGMNKVIEKETGKSTVKHVSDYVEQQNNQKKRNKIISDLVEEHIKTTRLQLTLNN